MHTRTTRRPLTMAGVVALTGLVAACAQQRSAAYYPPPGQSYPPALSGSTGPAAAMSGNYTTTAGLHLRAGPGSGAPIMSTLPPGTPVRTNGMVEGNWWGVATPAGNGWVYDRYLAPT